MLWPSIRYGGCGRSAAACRAAEPACRSADPLSPCREAGLLPQAQGVDILHQHIRRVLMAEIAVGMIFPDAFPMAQMVMSDDQNPPVREDRASRS